MFITDKINSLGPNEKFVSFEFFPPKTTGGFKNLLARLSRMQALNPLFVSVTWGAGGSTSEKTLDLAATCQKDIGLTTLLHLTCTNTNKEIIDDALAKAKLSGIRNILALRGDPPRTEEYWTPNCDFSNAVDLVKYIKQQYGDYFCIGVAGYPEGHVEGADDSHQNPEKDIPYLIEKINAGADFIITQLFYDADKFVTYDKILKSHDELKNVILIPGLMPITTYNIFKKACKFSHASIPKTIDTLLEQHRNNDDEVKEVGIEIINSIIKKLSEKTSVRGFHFYTLNLEKAAASIIESNHSLRSILREDPLESAIASDDEDDYPTVPFARRKSSVSNEIDAKIHMNKELLVKISKGKGALGKDANWDDFPNGRFGDSNSPAYGEIDGYGPTLKVSSPEQAKDLWGEPTSPQDLAKVFLNYLTGRLNQTPWVDTPVEVESTYIQEQLFDLNQKGWFSVASQPAVGGVLSNDGMFGWGPPNGIIYQKSFVELFVPKADWEKKIKPGLKESFEDKTITYYLGDKTGRLESNLSIEGNYVKKTALTWGVFPSKEVVQPTIMDIESFKAWNEEAFLLWLEWSRCYKKNSQASEFLTSVYDNYYLVSLVHHDFTNENGLWDALLSIQ